MLGKIIGGWQLSGIFVAQSGHAAEHHRQRHGPEHARHHSAIPNLTGDEHACSAGSARAGSTSIPSVYSLPAAGVQGNMKRNGGPEGPGFWELDSSLFKRFSVGGSRYAEIHVDAYNVTNSVRWGNPGTGLQHRRRQYVRPDHRHHRRPAQPPIRREVRVLKQLQLPADSHQPGSSFQPLSPGLEAGPVDGRKLMAES